jgi:protease-4
MKDLLRSIFNIFRWMGKFLSGVRVFTLNMVFLALLGFIIVSIVSRFASDQETIGPAKGALILSLSGNIVEEKQPIDPFSAMLNETFDLNTLPDETLFQDILDAIESAETDDNVSLILLDLSKLGSVGLNQLKSIGIALNSFKESGKKVIAAEDAYEQKAYYLASFASEIYLNPMGAVDLHGIGSYRLFFKDGLDKLRINYNIFRVGTFKSALEPVMRNSMSPAARSQNMTWLTALWQVITTDIIRERKLKPDTIDNYTRNIASELLTAGGDTAQLALNSGLVDGLKSREELRSFLRSLAGAEGIDSFNHIPLQDYLNTIPRSFVSPPDENGNIGIIVAEGSILNGDKPVGVIGGDSMAKMIREARNDAHINALVLRIVSGGGSVFASEIIRQEILEFRKTGKPLVVSMGAMAASGGYWIAADADKILASAVTLTGSIGIFAAIPTFEDSLGEIGVYSDGVGTTTLAAGLDITRPLSPLLKEAIAINLRHGYDQFLEIVGNGRGIKRQQVMALAEGRVFDGKAALQLGLVDELGNLDDALDAAADLAGLEDYSASYIRRPLSAQEEFLQFFQGTVAYLFQNSSIPPVLLNTLNRLLEPVSEFTSLNDPKGLYAHCLVQDLSL